MPDANYGLAQLAMRLNGNGDKRIHYIGANGAERRDVILRPFFIGLIN